jgi:hypothetical protein
MIRWPSTVASRWHWPSLLAGVPPGTLWFMDGWLTALLGPGYRQRMAKAYRGAKGSGSESVFPIGFGPQSASSVL